MCLSLCSYYEAAIKVKLGIKGNKINGNEANILIGVSILLNDTGVRL